jgi:hypothetical protein
MTSTTDRNLSESGRPSGNVAGEHGEARSHATRNALSKVECKQGSAIRHPQLISKPMCCINATSIRSRQVLAHKVKKDRNDDVFPAHPFPMHACLPGPRSRQCRLGGTSLVKRGECPVLSDAPMQHCASDPLDS